MAILPRKVLGYDISFPPESLAAVDLLASGRHFPPSQPSSGVARPGGANPPAGSNQLRLGDDNSLIPNHMRIGPCDAILMSEVNKEPTP